MKNNQVLLEVENLTFSFGAVRAVHGVSFSLRKKELKGLVGPNGAGKTTIFNLVTGFYKPHEGKIVFKGKNITGEAPHKIAAFGLGRTFQQVRIIKEMTVLENVLIGCHRNLTTTYLDAALSLKNHRENEKLAYEKSNEYLEMVGLADVANEKADQLPIGKERLLQIARSLAMEPDLLMLDEPAAGLNETETMVLAKLIQNLNEQGRSIILVEHNMNLVMGICHNILVINYGQKIAEGTPWEIQNNSKVIEAYLGVEEEEHHVVEY